MTNTTTIKTATFDSSKEVNEKSKSSSLFDRVGGQSVLDAAFDEFYFRLLCDEELLVFFEGAATEFLKAHQRQFMTFAFKEIPKHVNVSEKISRGHARMFQMGLSEAHFDLVANHLVETLLVLSVEQEIIDEVLANVAPVRAVFQDQAKHLEEEKEEEVIQAPQDRSLDATEESKDDSPMQDSSKDDCSPKSSSLFDRLGGQPVLDAAFDEFYFRLLCDGELLVFFDGADTEFLKAHQRQFLTFAFKEIPKHVNVSEKISRGHARMFKMGLSEVHFDLVANHLVETLLMLSVEQEIIDEVLANVAPVRAVFQDQAKRMQEKEKEEKAAPPECSMVAKEEKNDTRSRTKKSIGQRLRNIVGRGAPDSPP